MPLPLVAAFWSTFTAILIPLLMRAVVALGFFAVTYAGIKELVDYLLEQVQSRINSLPPETLQYVAVFNIDRFMTIVFSAFIVKLVFMGLTATGSISRIQWRAGA